MKHLDMPGNEEWESIRIYNNAKLAQDKERKTVNNETHVEAVAATTRAVV